MAYVILQDLHDNEIRVPARWEICPACRGEGGSSAYMGAFSAEEFDREFDYEEKEAYFRGDYDRPCEACKGSGKVAVPIVSACNFSQKRALVAERMRARWEAESRAERRRESMMLGEY